MSRARAEGRGRSGDGPGARDDALAEDGAGAHSQAHAQDRTPPHWLRTFLIIFAGQGFSLLGSAAVNFAFVWWLTAETGSATVLAYASIAAILPQALLGPLAGPYIDRWDRRITMIAADVAIAAASAVMLFAFRAGTPPIGLVVAIIAVRSAGAAFHTPASQAAVPMYVPADQLMRVAGWNFFLSSGVAMAGPVLGAFLMTTASIEAVIGLDIVGAALAVTSLMLVRIPHPERAEAVGEGALSGGRAGEGGLSAEAVGEGALGGEPGAGSARFIAEFAEGWRELVRHRGLLDLTLAIAAVTVLYMPLNALFPLMTFEHFNGGAAEASYVELAFGAGMLAGSLALGVFLARVSGVRLVAGAIVGLGALVAVSGLLPAGAFWVFVGLCVLMGVTAPLFGAPITAMFQTLIDPAKLGRVMSLYTTIAMLAAPVGLVAAGPIAERTGVAAWFAVTGVLIAVMGVVVWALPSVRGLDGAMEAVTAAAGEVAEA